LSKTSQPGQLGGDVLLKNKHFPASHAAM